MFINKKFLENGAQKRTINKEIDENQEKGRKGRLSLRKK